MSDPMLPTLIALAALTATLLGALVAAVWRFSALATSMKTTIASLEKSSQEWREHLAALQRIPLLEQRVGQTEQVCTKFASLVPKLSAEIQALSIKLESYRDAEVWRRSGGDFK